MAHLSSASHMGCDLSVKCLTNLLHWTINDSTSNFTGQSRFESNMYVVQRITRSNPAVPICHNYKVHVTVYLIEGLSRFFFFSNGEKTLPCRVMIQLTYWNMRQKVSLTAVQIYIQHKVHGSQVMSPFNSRGSDPTITVAALQWSNNGRDGASNHQPHDRLLSRLFGRRSKKTSKLYICVFYHFLTVKKFS